MPLVLSGKQYEVYVTVLQGQAGGTLIYIDAHGHIHVEPTGPDSRRIAEELQRPIALLNEAAGQVAHVLAQEHVTA